MLVRVNIELRLPDALLFMHILIKVERSEHGTEKNLVAIVLVFETCLKFCITFQQLLFTRTQF